VSGVSAPRIGVGGSQGVARVKKWRKQLVNGGMMRDECGDERTGARRRLARARKDAGARKSFNAVPEDRDRSNS
jgi:hypothetical protein